MRTKPVLLVIIIMGILLTLFFGYSVIESKWQEKENESDIEVTNITISKPDKKFENVDNPVIVLPEKTTEDTTKDGEKSVIGSLDFDSEDALILHKISIAEAGGESVECMALIMLVILNRTWIDEFPNSIEDVVFQKVNGVAQFTPTINGSYDRAEPNEKSNAAMKLVLSGWNESQNALYFESCEGESWHSRNLEFLFEKDGVRFYK